MAVAISRNATDPASVASSGGVTSYTGVSIGTAVAGRWVYVGVTAETTGAADPTSATINAGAAGVIPMTALTLASFGSMRARWFKARCDWGTTADIAITWSAAVSNVENHITVYTVTGMGDVEVQESTNTSTDMDATVPLTTGAITINANGGFIAVACGATASTAAKTWANATEDLEVSVTNYCHTTATRTTSLAATAVTCTGGTNNEDGALAWVRFDSGTATNLVPVFEMVGFNNPHQPKPKAAGGSPS